MTFTVVDVIEAIKEAMVETEASVKAVVVAMAVTTETKSAGGMGKVQPTSA
jgi:hypothetical protein